MGDRYKTFLRRHPTHIIPWGIEEGFFLSWSGDGMWLERRSLSDKKIVDRCYMPPLAGVVRERPWKPDD
jgi:hypothetical protein